MKHLLSVVIMLLALTCCTSEADRIRMRAGLDSINMRNRNDQPFTVSDVQPYVTFFDEHGTPNDRLLARYLLGRAYYDHGEAPMALECYQKAADCADTLSADCDYAQLARVYGQMARIFYQQGLYREQLEYCKHSVKYAWQAKDTLAALLKYLESGRHQNSAISLGFAILPLIDKGNFKKARDYINKYESLSGRFDSTGNIEAGREIFYNVKGLFFLYTKKYDSAEYFFRKELYDGKDFNNQNAASKGLAELYQRLHQPDSV